VWDETEDTVGAGIRFNGDDDNSNGVGHPRGNGVPDYQEDIVPGDDDLIELTFEFGATSAPAGVEYVIERSNASVKIWDSTKSGAVLTGTSNQAVIPFAPTASLWVEWVNPILGQADAILTFKARDAVTKAPLGTPDSVRVFRFTSEVIVIGGNGQVPRDPAPEGAGLFTLARWLYLDGYDVHMFAHDAVMWENRPNSGAGAAYNEVVSAVNERNVTNVSVIGFSWGGGATYDLLARLEWAALPANRVITKAFSIAFTATIDAIRHIDFMDPDFYTPDNRDPMPLTNYDINYFQRNTNSFIRGAARLRPGGLPSLVTQNVEVTTRPWGGNLTHTTIDDSFDVLIGIQDRLTKRLNR